MILFRILRGCFLVGSTHRIWHRCPCRILCKLLQRCPHRFVQPILTQNPTFQPTTCVYMRTYLRTFSCPYFIFYFSTFLHTTYKQPPTLDHTFQIIIWSYVEFYEYYYFYSFDLASSIFWITLRLQKDL